MAIVKNVLGIEGNIGDMNFYKAKGKYHVRRRPGVRKNRIMKDPEFARTRENMSEFKDIQLSSKALRSAFKGPNTDVKSGSSTPKLFKVLTAIKKLDTTSVRGSRNISTGIATPEGKATLTGFNFNQDAGVPIQLSSLFELDAENGILSIPGLIPVSVFNKPEFADKVGLSLHWAKVDFTHYSSKMSGSDEIQLSLFDSSSSDIVLNVADIPTVPGVNVFLLRMVYYKTINVNSVMMVGLGEGVVSVIGVG